jgi:hypothetical protein
MTPGFKVDLPDPRRCEDHDLLKPMDRVGGLGTRRDTLAPRPQTG